MQINEALDLLKHHSHIHEDSENRKTERGFLGMLRPFTGHLYEENYLELLEIITVLQGCLRPDLIPKDVVAALWAICHYARAWGLHPDGMLQRNNLISGEQVAKLSAWVEHISSEVLELLESDGEGNNPD